MDKEGKLITTVSYDIAKDMVNRMYEFLEGKNAAIIEMAADAHPEVVTVTAGIGRKRIIDMLVVSNAPGFTRKIDYFFNPCQ